MMSFLKTLSLAVIALAAFGATSCGCCTGEANVPSLQPLPKFKDVPVIENAPVVDDAK